MKKTFLKVAAVAIVCATMVCACGNTNSNITEGKKNQMDSLSYCLGANIGGGLAQQLVGVDFDLVSAHNGFVEGITKTAAQSHDEALEILRTFFSETYAERMQAYHQALEADSTAVLKLFVSEEERADLSYAFGNDLGCNLGKSKLKLQYYWLWKGFEGGWHGAAEMSQEEVMAFLNHYFMQVVPKEAAERSAAWIAKKSKQRGVKTTESGLAYKVLEPGDMSKAAVNDSDVVRVHYIGKLQDGTVFDTSLFEHRPDEYKEMMRKYQPSLFDEKGNYIQEDEPVEFPLNGVIKGWTEGMKLVGPGGKIELYIPADLAYGRNGAGQLIGPNEALEFVVELLEVNPTAAEATPETAPEVVEEQK